MNQKPFSVPAIVVGSILNLLRLTRSNKDEPESVVVIILHMAELHVHHSGIFLHFQI